jgi:enoyl-CoA hydratase
MSLSISGTENLSIELEGTTMVVTMNRPEVKNALSVPMLVGMADAWVEADENDAVRAIILTGAGGDFCTGMDLKAFAGDQQGDPKYQQRMADDPDLHWKALLRHYQPKKPLIAAVEGYAVAGGTEILQGTDIRVAGESAKFGVTEVQRGLFPMAGSAVRLRRQIPYAIAAEMLLCGEDLPARRAYELGLVNHVVPDGQALAKAKEIAARIATNGPLAVKGILATLRETEAMPEEEAFVIEQKYGMQVMTSQDAAEGPRAFLEKRKPVFTGK